jgi:hypothetical protein
VEVGAPSSEGVCPFNDEKDPLAKRETLELVRAYYKIDDDKVRKRLFKVVKTVGAASLAHKLATAGKRKGTK